MAARCPRSMSWYALACALARPLQPRMAHFTVEVSLLMKPLSGRIASRFLSRMVNSSAYHISCDRVNYASRRKLPILRYSPLLPLWTRRRDTSLKSYWAGLRSSSTPARCGVLWAQQIFWPLLAVDILRSLDKYSRFIIRVVDKNSGNRNTGGVEN